MFRDNGYNPNFKPSILDVYKQLKLIREKVDRHLSRVEKGIAEQSLDSNPSYYYFDFAELHELAGNVCHGLNHGEDRSKKETTKDAEAAPAPA